MKDQKSIRSSVIERSTKEMLDTVKYCAAWNGNEENRRKSQRGDIYKYLEASEHDLEQNAGRLRAIERDKSNHTFTFNTKHNK